MIAFVEWAASTYEFDVPRNLRRKKYNQHVDKDGEAKCIDSNDLGTIEDLRLEASYGPLYELIAILCLNCGFANSDLHHLTGNLDP